MGTLCTNLEAERSLFCEYSQSSLQSLLSSSHTLAVFSFDGTAKDSEDPRLVHTGLESVASQIPLTYEVWRSSLPVTHGKSDNINWASNGELLFCALYIEDQQDIETAGETSYKALLDFIGDKNFPYIDRAWNYFSAINEGQGDEERYKRFCAGRHNAFEAFYPEAAAMTFPSACAIGHKNGGINVYLLASKNPGRHFENPDQMSAYHYPRQYGPKSPSFARATLTQGKNTSYLYVSGTAAIKGHETIYPGNTAKQLEVTLDNIDRLLDHVAASAELKTSPTMASVKVYLRKAEDEKLVKQKILSHFNRASVLFVQGDICRYDLEIEIDGVCFIG